MATEVPMPKLGLTMEEGTIVEWMVADGTVVETDQPILMIETDKTQTEVGSPGGGRLHTTGAVGDTYACGELIGWLLAEGEQPPAAATPGPAAAPVAPVGTASSSSVAAPAVASATGGRILASPNARRVAAERGVPLHLVRGTGPGGRIVSEDIPESAPAPAPVSAPAAGSGDVVATFAARQLADLLGVDLRQVTPDPVERRVTRQSVALYVRERLAAAPALQEPTPPPAPAAAPALQEPTEIVRLSGMRGTIARRMHASLQEMAQLTLATDADMSAVLADRADRKAEHGSAPSITDYVIAAASRALLDHPRMNSQITADGIALLPEIHMGLAVAVDNGLLVPVIRDAAHRDLADLSAEARRLATAARDGKLSPADMEGGTFSVSALGTLGVDMFTPVINPPNAGILGVGRLRDELVLHDGDVTARPTLTLSLTWDHRVLDGAPAAEYAQTICRLLADPARLD